MQGGRILQICSGQICSGQIWAGNSTVREDANARALPVGRRPSNAVAGVIARATALLGACVGNPARRAKTCRRLLPAVLCALLLGVAGCEAPWNSPYPAADADRNIFYDTFSERPKHLDPVSSYSENEAIFNAQIYEPVVQYHYLKRPYALEPLTAVTTPEPTYYGFEGEVLGPDAPGDTIARTVYRITIQPGIEYQPHPALARDDAGAYRYHGLTKAEIAGRKKLADFAHSGSRELKAQDYVYQIKRLVHPRVHSPVAGFMMKYIKGLSELAETLAAVETDKAGYIDLRDYPLDGVRVVDDYTFEIELTEKYPQFVYWLAMNFFAPIPWEADAFYRQAGMAENNLTLDWYPIGTGPYMLTENNPNRRMVLARNPNFRGEPYPDEGSEADREAGLLADAGKPMPFVDEAHFLLEKEAIPAWNKFLQGYYDASGIVSDSFDQAIRFNTSGDAALTPQMQEKGIELKTSVTTSIFYLGFNMADEVIGGDSERARKIRQAVSIAIDFEEFISIFLNGRGVTAQGPLPPGIFGYREAPFGVNPYVYKVVDGRYERKSAADARALMAEAGYVDGRDVETGEPLVLYFDTYSGGAGAKAVFDWYRKQFEKIGVQLVIRGTDYNRFQEKMRNGTAQIYSWGWNADYPDPENFYFLLYGPNAKVLSQGENASNYQNPEFDRLFLRMKSMPNGPERQAVIDEMQALVQRDAPWIWGYYPMAYSLYHQWYLNNKPNLMARNTLKYKRIDPVIRAEARTRWNTPVLWPVWLTLGVLAASILPAVITYRRAQRRTAR